MSLSCNKTDRSGEMPPHLGVRGSGQLRVAFFWTLLWTSFVHATEAAPLSIDSFEGPETAWEIGEADTTIQIRKHSRVRSPVHSGAWAEGFELFCSGGSFAYAQTAVKKATVIEELAFSLWLRADRPGLQLAARVVLPRSIDSETGEALTVKIYGDSYQAVGRWQQVFLDHIVNKVRRQSRVAQSGQSNRIDAREAYIDQILINLHGGQGTTTVWIDDLTTAGLVAHQPQSQFSNLPSSYRTKLGVTTSHTKHSVDLNGPAVARIIEYQGEPFAFLRGLGFNCLLLQQIPTPQQRLQAAKHDLWLLGPPMNATARAAEANTTYASQTPLLWYPPRPPEESPLGGPATYSNQPLKLRSFCDRSRLKFRPRLRLPRNTRFHSRKHLTMSYHHGPISPTRKSTRKWSKK